MRWAPNRKMHFEVAIIRAIQTLGQATLSEVLETLTAMRGGGGAPPPARPAAVAAPARPATAPAPRPVPPRPVAPKIAETPPPKPAPLPGIAETPPPRPAPLPKIATAPAPVVPPEQPAPASVLAKPEPASAPDAEAEQSPFAESAPAPEPIDPGAIWTAVIQEVRQKRPLIGGWVEAGRLMRLEKGVALVAFPQEAGFSADYCQQPTHRKFLEEILSHLAGEPMTLKTELRAGLQVTPPPPAVAVAPEPPRDKEADFRDDPLIRKALDLFQAQIQPA